jgi:integrase
MARVKFTSGTIDGAVCEMGKSAQFTWDSVAPGLGLRVTPAGTKRYIFQAKVKNQREVVRVKIGDVGNWTIEAARAEARRLKVLMDGGHDPRQVEADGLAAKQAVRDAQKAAADAKKLQEHRDSVKLGDIWPLYVTDRTPQWSALHLRDHLRIIQAGGIQRTRSPKLTEPGPLASLAGVRLVDLTAERIEQWAKVEAAIRPTRARLALRLLKACLFWCTAHADYAGTINANGALSKKARESLGKPKTKKYDLLAREQLSAWFAAVRQIGNPVISAYLQTLLLTGARREELACLKFEDVDFQWNSIKLADKVEDFRMVPLTPYVKHLLQALPRRDGGWVFSSPTAKSGHVTEPSIAHRKACVIAGLDVSLHGLRRSFATLSEWTETPAGIAAQIQGHQPQGVRENNYIFRPLDLLRMWHIKIEAWILEQAGIEFVPVQPSLRVVNE